MPDVIRCNDVKSCIICIVSLVLKHETRISFFQTAVI